MMKNKSNNEKIALVVGGSRGIGKAIAIRLARSGFNIWLTYQSNHDFRRQLMQFSHYWIYFSSLLF